MKKLFITTLFFLAIGLEMKAQAVFMPGYIIDKKGDTLNGEIKVNHKKEIDLYKKIFFRKDEKEAPKQYAPTAIQGFKVEDKFFEPVKITASTPGCFTSAAPIFPSPGKKLQTLSGKPDSFKISMLTS